MDSYVLTQQDIDSLMTVFDAVFIAGVVLGLVVAPWVYWLVIGAFRYITKSKKEQPNANEQAGKDASERSMQKQSVAELPEACGDCGAGDWGSASLLDMADQCAGECLLRRPGMSAFNGGDLSLGKKIAHDRTAVGCASFQSFGVTPGRKETI